MQYQYIPADEFAALLRSANCHDATAENVCDGRGFDSYVDDNGVKYKPICGSE